LKFIPEKKEKKEKLITLISKGVGRKISKGRGH